MGRLQHVAAEINTGEVGALEQCVEDRRDLGAAPGVLSLGSITLDGGQTVPVLGADQPSFIWYAAQQPNARPLAMKVMKQDLIATGWQDTMAGGAAL